MNADFETTNSTNCNSVRWYFVIPNDIQQSPISASETSSVEASLTTTIPSTSEQPLDIASVLQASSNEITLISSHCFSVDARARGFHVACKVLDGLLTPVYEAIPHIDGFVIESSPEAPEYSAGQVMIHARRPDDWTNLPVATSYLPPGYPLKVRDTPWPTVLVPLGAYENLSPVTVKPSTPNMYIKHRRSDSGIGLASDEDEVEGEPMAMEMDEEYLNMKYDPGCDLTSGLADDSGCDEGFDLNCRPS